MAVDNEQYRLWVASRWGVELEGGEGFRAVHRLLGSAVEYRRMDAFALDGLEERFDLVYCFGILHRVENPLGLLRVLRGRTVDGGTVLVETYGVGPEDRNGPAIRVSEPGEVYARDDFVYWGFGDAGLRAACPDCRLLARRVARQRGGRRPPAASSAGWSPRSSRTAFCTASSQNNNQWSLLPLRVRGVERVQLCANPGAVRLAVWRRAPAELLVGRVAASGFLNLPRLRKLGQASGDASSIEVQALGHLASCAPGMLAQELDDARLGVNLAGARGCTTSARSPSGGAAPRASRRCRRCPVVVRVELLDLLIEPGETLLEFRALGFERVDHLLNAGQELLLLRRDLLGLWPETCCVRGTSTRAQDDVAHAREVRKRGMCCSRWYPE